MKARGWRTEPIGAAFMSNYNRVRAEDSVGEHAMSSRNGRSRGQGKAAQEGSSPVRTIVDGLLELAGSLEAKGKRSEVCCAASSGPRGPLYRATITSKVTECAPSSGTPISAGEHYWKQTCPHKVAGNGELSERREDVEPTKKAPARRPVYGAMVMPSAWPQK